MPEHNSIINRTALRDFLLKFAADTRHHRFTRVSEDTMNMLEAKLRVIAIEHVKSMPSVGKTL